MYKITEDKVRRATKFLKKDILDDWYGDLQNYADIFSDVPKITRLVNQKIEMGRGIYTAHKSVLLNIPKGNGGFRYTLELSPIDRIAFHIFGFELIELLDKSLPFNILSHRRSLDDDTLFKPPIEQWNKFENFTKITGSNKFIIETDLSNYFDNIELEKLRNELIAASTQAGLSSEDFLRCMYLIESVISMLKIISFDGKRGLPQNRDISSFLSNIYMRHLDLRLKGETYFRYVDDIRLVAETRSEANRLMLLLVETIRGFGLSINSSKTKILTPGTEEHFHFINDFEFEAKKIDAMLNSGKRKYVNLSFFEIYKGTLNLLEQNKIHCRKFRYYANRLITFFNAKDVCIPKKYKDAIATRLVGAINSRPDCADQICALAQAIGPCKKLQTNLVEWATDRSNLTFEWAVYSVIKTLAKQDCRNTLLQKYCMEQLKDITVSDPIKGISAVFLNRKAGNLIISLLAQSNSHFLQRHLLIALAHEPPEILKRKKAVERIQPDFVGTHFQLHKSSKSTDFALIRHSERLSQRVLIKELRNYV